MPLLDYSFVESGRTLKLTAGIPDGWRKHQKTCCFSEQIVFDWKFDHKIRAEIQVFPRPGGFFDAVASWPMMDGEGAFDSICYKLKESNLESFVPLLISGLGSAQLLPDGSVPNPSLAWRTTENGKLAIHSIEDMLGVYEGILYELQVLLIVQPRPSAPGPVLFDWCKRFCPGGLPSLGKRR